MIIAKIIRVREVEFKFTIRLILKFSILLLFKLNPVGAKADMQWNKEDRGFSTPAALNSTYRNNVPIDSIKRQI